MDPQSRGRLVRATLIVLLLVGLAILTAQLAHVLLIVFGAAVVAALLRLFADPLSRRGVPDLAAVSIAVVLVVGIIAGFMWLLGPQIADQMTQLSQQLPQAWSGVQQQLAQLPFGDRLVSTLGSGISINDIAGRIGSLATTTLGALATFIIIVVGGVYLAVAPKTYATGIARLFPEHDRGRVEGALSALGPALKKFLLGQFIAMLLVGLLVGVGLSIVGVPAAAALGFIAFLLEFIPTFGAYLSAIPGLLLALTVGPDVFLGALAVYVAVQFLEGNFITPLVQRHEVDLPPALLIFALLAFGVLFGPLGVILAAPLTAAVYTLVVKLYSRNTLHEDVRVPGSEHAHDGGDGS